MTSTRTHGRSYDQLYGLWASAKGRCHNPNDTSFSRYGGRGIMMCDRWRESFEAFAADMGERPEGTSLERIDNDGPYSPENCRWATRIEQQRNMRTTILVETEQGAFSLRDFARHSGVHPASLVYRMRTTGLPAVDAVKLITPRRKAAA